MTAEDWCPALGRHSVGTAVRQIMIAHMNPSSDVRPSSALDNVDPRLSGFWYLVGLSQDPPPTEVTLLGQRLEVDECAGLSAHLGIWWCAPSAPIAPLPQLEEHQDPSFVVVHSPPEVWSSSAAQMADNFLDISHIPFLHRASFADSGAEPTPRLSPTAAEYGFTVTYHHRTRRLHGEGSGRRVMTICFTAPFCVTMRLEYLDDNAVITAGFFMQPIDADHTRLFAVNWRDDILDGRCTRAETIEFQQLVAAEDRSMLEQIPTHWVPHDLRCEVHTRADVTTVEMRRTLSRLLEPVG